jgi:hypothetical protein
MTERDTYFKVGDRVSLSANAYHNDGDLNFYPGREGVITEIASGILKVDLGAAMRPVWIDGWYFYPDELVKEVD